jgi:YVTN family beta-propeller protein
LSQLPIDPDADRSRRAWLACPNCNHGEDCEDCRSNRDCGTHWHYLLNNDGRRVVLQCATCAHVWTADSARSKADGDASTQQPAVATIAVGGRACEVVASPDGDRVYVSTADSVKVISRLRHTVASVGISPEPKHLTLSADGTRLYVTRDDGPLAVIDTTDYAVRAVVAEPSTAEVVSADGNRIYAIHHTMFDTDHHSWVSVLGADGTTVETIPVDSYATALALSRDGGRLYVAASKRSPYHPNHRGWLSVIDTGTDSIVEIIALHDAADTVTASPDGSRVYVTHYDTNAISVVDLATYHVISVDLGDAPLALTLTPDGAGLWVANLHSVAVLDTATLGVESLCVGDLPRRVQLSGDGKLAFVLDFAHQTVWVLDAVSRSVITTVEVGGRPQAMALSADGQFLYVTDYRAGTVTVISVASVVT